MRGLAGWLATPLRARTLAWLPRHATTLALLVTVLAAASPNASLGLGQTHGTVSGSLDPSGPNLAVAPADWWMIEGTNVSLRASWTEIPPGCTLSPTWFRWSVAVGGALGTLTTDNRSQTNFTASGLGTGATALVVRSAAALVCGSNRTATVRAGRSNLTIDAPLTLRNLSMTPDPIRSGTASALTGTIVGGQPPYSLRVAWGDGTVGWTNASVPGMFSFSRTFETGVYAPALLVEDGAGFLANGSVEEPLNVSPEFAVGIVPSTLVAEVGVAVALSIADVNPPAGFSSLLSCGGATPSDEPDRAPSTGLACTFAGPGTSLVALEAVGVSSPFAVASALLAETVVPPLTVHLPNVSTNVEANLPGYAPVVLSGGVPPFEVSWHVVGNQSTQESVASADGTLYAAVRIDVAGADVLSVTVTDALGVTASSANETIDVLAPLSANAAMASAGPAPGGGVNLSAAVLAGSPPFDWAVVPSVAPENSTEPAGALTAIGSFSWNATYRAEGTLTVEVIVLDAAGAIWRGNVSTGLVAPLRVSVDLSPASSTGFDAAITVSGGAPPFAYWINDSTGGAWNGSDPDDGTLTVRELAPASGNTTFTITVRDGLGFENATEATVDLAAPTESSLPVSGNFLAFGAILVTLAGAAGAGAWWWRRRGPSLPAPGPDPETTLRNIIAPADGADRAVVELVAEEEGVPMTVARETLDRLIARGTIRAERGLDGEEVLAWSHGPEP